MLFIRGIEVLLLLIVEENVVVQCVQKVSIDGKNCFKSFFRLLVWIVFVLGVDFFRLWGIEVIFINLIGLCSFFDFLFISKIISFRKQKVQLYVLREYNNCV